MGFSQKAHNPMFVHDKNISFYYLFYFNPVRTFIIRGSQCHGDCLYGDTMHESSLMVAVMTMERRIVVVLLPLPKTLDVDLIWIVVADETEKSKE